MAATQLSVNGLTVSATFDDSGTLRPYVFRNELELHGRASAAVSVSLA